MAKAIKTNMPFIRRLCIHNWEANGRKGAFQRVFVDPQDGHIYYDTMTDRFELGGWVIAKIKGIYKLVTQQEADKAEYESLVAKFA